MPEIECSMRLGNGCLARRFGAPFPRGFEGRREDALAVADQRAEALLRFLFPSLGGGDGAGRLGVLRGPSLGLARGRGERRRERARVETGEDARAALRAV